MCDTFVALPEHTASGNLIFGKNSDREPNEAQAIVRLPGGPTQDKAVRCTFIEIPQASNTHEVILSKPYQMWGAEMGVNEHGLVIGNEAIFTKLKLARTNNGLTGMDLVRLALERCNTAKDALRTITELLETYGQDACGGYRNKNFFYHNSFLIADARSAWVLETADRHWVAERVYGFRSISNGLTIESDYDLISADAIDFAVRKGWAKSRNRFGFRQAYSDWLYTKGSNCRRRQQHSAEMGEAFENRFAVLDAIRILSSHDRANSQFSPSRSTSASICMHATGMTNPSQSNGSMVAEIRQGQPPTIWLTGTSMPCLSVYLPFFFGQTESVDNPCNQSTWNTPGAGSDQSFWWQAERLHRQVCRNYAAEAEPFRQAQREMQCQFLEADQQLVQSDAGLEKRLQFSENAVERFREFIQTMGEATGTSTDAKSGYLYRYYWKRINRQVGLS
jgi:dipeptidase